MIEQIMIGACNACQLRCEHCAHRGLRSLHPNYQMPLEDVSALCNHMESAGIRTGIFMLNGPGEPLLWDHFNSAVRLLHGGHLAGSINIATNGLRLSAIADDVWPMLGRVCISRYGQVLGQELIQRHSEQIDWAAGEVFSAIVPDSLPVLSPTFCSCYGPLYYKGYIFPHCGPPLFGAAALAGLNPFTCAVPLDEWNPDTVQSIVPKNCLPCAWCFANGAVPKTSVDNRLELRSDP